MNRKKIAYLFLNGDLEGDKKFYEKFMLENSGDIYCADGGYRYCRKLGIEPLEIWGDMDSIEKFYLDEITDKNIKVKKFPKDKDFTDGELILQYLSEKEYEQVYIIAGLGGDMAHELTNLNLMTKYRNAVFITEREKIFLLKNSEILNLKKNSEISFVPMSDSVENLSLKGFKYPLENYNLMRWESRCMSNIAVSENTEVTFDRGILMGIIKNS